MQVVFVHKILNDNIWRECSGVVATPDPSCLSKHSYWLMCTVAVLSSVVTVFLLLLYPLWRYISFVADLSICSCIACIGLGQLGQLDL